MKTKEELQKEYDLLCNSKTKIKASFNFKLPNGIEIQKNFTLYAVLDWQDGTKGNVWVQSPNAKDSGTLYLDDLEEDIRKQYNARIKQFCKDSDEFEAAGGEVGWF